jgi:A/G-specific adenine glycosylase
VERDPSARVIAGRLARWYRAHRRALPWRASRDPYAIWISEVMLQQTTVEVVEPRWKRFLERFPTVERLAGADVSEVEAEWSGLGYYARARNLHRAAAVIARRGVFPRTVDALRKLPGIGPYTASAVASIAFDVPAAVVDGNVARVLCRLYGSRIDARSPRGLSLLRRKADALVPKRAAGDHNQAVMELGALVCTPRAPRCGICPLRTLCRAAASGKPEGFPRPAKRQAPRLIHLVAGIVERKKKILLVEDEEFVAGHLVVPMFRTPSGKRPAKFLRKGWKRVAGRDVGPLELVATLRHSVLERRYLVSLFTFKEKAPSPSPHRRLEAGRVRLVPPNQISRHFHGGFLLKVLAAWRKHAS